MWSDGSPRTVRHGSRDREDSLGTRVGPGDCPGMIAILGTGRHASVPDTGPGERPTSSSLPFRDLHDLFADVLPFEQPEERVGGVPEPLGHRLPVAQFVLADPAGDALERL